MRFIITTHPGIDGARLSLCGQWGNEPHASVDAAEVRAKAIAAGKPHAIERQHMRTRRGG